MHKNFFPSIIIAIGLALLGLFIKQGILSFRSFDKFVEVKGLDERLVKSNEASWSINFYISGSDIQDINVKVSDTTKKIIEFAISKGFTKEEIDKGPLRVTDEYEYYYDKKKNRYSARGSIVIGSKKVDLLTKVFTESDELLKQGILTSTSDVKYYFKDLNSIKPEMLKAATKNAYEAASSFAEHSNSKLGGIRTATQGVFTIESPYSEYDKEGSIMKKIRVVTRVSYFLD